MRRATTILAGLLLATAPGALALAQSPYSTHASNITAADTRSVIAPRLPTPPVASFEPPDAFLATARQALAEGRTGEAQEALERAETRLLDRSTAPATADTPDDSRAVLDIGAARHALAAHDIAGATRAIDDALVALARPPTSPPYVAAIAPAVPPGVIMMVPPSPPPLPPVTYALLPGHWQLSGANWVWVPPETTPRLVVDQAYIEGRYVWRGGRWVWVPGHTRVE